MYKVVSSSGSLSTIWPLEAFGYYHKLPGQKKLLLVQDGIEKTVLSSKGEDNIDRLHLRPMFNLMIRRTAK